MEGALKMARSHGSHIHPDKYEILSLENSFHGRSLGALSVTGQPKYRKDFEPLLPGVRFVEKNDLVALESAFSERTAAMILEVIQGEGGVYPIDREYLEKARELCNRYNALLIFDETQCGVGRTGAYFAYQNFAPAIPPDVMVAAKPIACGVAARLYPRPTREPPLPSPPACTAPPSEADRSCAASRLSFLTCSTICSPTSGAWARTSAPACLRPKNAAESFDRSAAKV